jgi:hypothetical protein
MTNSFVWLKILFGITQIIQTKDFVLSELYEAMNNPNRSSA